MDDYRKKPSRNQELLAEINRQFNARTPEQKREYEMMGIQESMGQMQRRLDELKRQEPAMPTKEQTEAAAEQARVLRESPFWCDHEGCNPAREMGVLRRDETGFSTWEGLDYYERKQVLMHYGHWDGFTEKQEEKAIEALAVGTPIDRVFLAEKKPEMAEPVRPDNGRLPTPGEIANDNDPYTQGRGPDNGHRR